MVQPMTHFHCEKLKAIFLTKNTKMSPLIYGKEKEVKTKITCDTSKGNG